MSKLLHIFQIALLIQSAIFLSSNLSWAQNPLELIEGSEDIRLDGKSSTYIVRGNVRLVKEGTKMYCDSAYYHTKTRSVRAYGNVHVNKDDSLNMYCDSLFYDLDREFAKLWGNVRVRDLEYKLVTDSLDFYGKENKGVYRRDGVITSIVSPEKLTSKVGYFFTDINHFFFRGDVVYTNEEYKITTDTLKYNGQRKIAHFFGPTTVTGPDGLMYCEKGWYNMEDEEGVFQQNAFIDRENQYIEGDSLYYNGKDGCYIAKDRVLIRDTSHQVEFTGDLAKSFENERYGFITGHALAKNYDENGDTLYMHADSLFNYVDTLNDTRLILAHRDVKLFKLDIQGVCDSLTYDRETGQMNMYYDPVLWAKNAQLSADSMTVFEKDKDVKRAFLRLNALVVTEVDSGNYYNQITGKTLNAYFDSTQIRRVDIDGNAQTVYFMEDEKDEDTIVAVERSGMNRIYSSNISLFFEDGDISAATYREEPDGKMYPMDQIESKEEKVEGFKWDNSRRPISWYTMIMTDEERKVWDKHQQEKMRLLQPSSVLLLKDLSMDQLFRADEWMTKYSEENYHYLLDSIFDKNDSLVPFDFYNDITEKATVLKTSAKEIIGKIQFLQLNQLTDSLLSDTIFSSETLLKMTEDFLVQPDTTIVLKDTLLFRQLKNKLTQWLDTIYSTLDTSVVRERIQRHLEVEAMKVTPQNGGVVIHKNLTELDTLLYDTLQVSFDSIKMIVDDFSMDEDSLKVDSLLLNTDTLEQNSVLSDSSIIGDSTQQAAPKKELSKKEKKLLRLERFYEEVLSEMDKQQGFDCQKAFILYLERLKIDVKNIQRLSLLYCVEELQARLLHLEIQAETSTKDIKNEEIDEKETTEQNPSDQPNIKTEK